MEATGTAPRSLGFECKHVNYVRSNTDDNDDLLFIKENEHFSDGTVVPRIRMIKNHKRDFYITRPAHRIHEEKREFEKMERLQKFQSTQANLAMNITRALGQIPGKNSNRLNIVCRSPYVYGADVTTPVLVKNYYQNKWKSLISISTMASIDSETSMITEEIIMLSVTFKHRVRLIVVKDFVKNLPDPEKAIRNAAEMYIGDVLKARGANLEIEFVDNAGQCAFRSIQTAHEWKPDFLAAWNMDFDIPKIIDALLKYGYNPDEVFCDPAVPPKFRNTAYVQGKKQKETASGKVMSLSPAEQWHRLETPASWYMIDPMCVYYRLRIAFGKDSSYALDAILGKEKIKQKLKFTAADHLTGGPWHMFMQQNYPAEYCVYNIYDSIALELLDEKTTDLGRQISSLCGHSEYHRFGSQPRRLCDDLHFYAMETRNQVIGTTSDKMEIELDQHVIDLKDHIVTLPSFSVAENGLKCIEEMPNEPTMIFVHVADLDVEGTYPNEEILMNISRATTMMEVVDIQGLTEVQRRSIGAHLSGGDVNAAEISRELFKAPDLEQLMQMYVAEHNERMAA